MTVLRDQRVGLLFASFVLTVVSLVMVLIDLQSPVRVLVVLVSCLTGPGVVAVTYGGPMSASLRWSVVVAVSAAVYLLTSLVMVLTGAWHPFVAVVVLHLLTAVALGVGAVLATRTTPRSAL